MVEDRTIVHDVTFDGTNHIDLSESIPTGETWYIEEITGYSHGGGEATEIPLYVGIWNDSFDPGPYQADDGKAGVAPKIFGSSVEAVTNAMGAYASGGEKLVIGVSSYDSSQANITAVVTARRIL